MKNTLWKIWSIEHDGWWLPNWRGYTRNRRDAGAYSFDEACKIVANANMHTEVNMPPNEAMVEINAEGY